MISVTKLLCRIVVGTLSVFVFSGAVAAQNKQPDSCVWLAAVQETVAAVTFDTKPFEHVGTPHEGLVRVRETGTFHSGRGEYHVDSTTGEPAYSERFRLVSDVRDGRAKVVVGDGTPPYHIFVTGPNAGKPAYGYRYKEVESYSEGYALVQDKGKYFHIRLNGKPAYGERFDYAKSVSGGLAVVRQGRWSMHIHPDTGKPAYDSQSPARYIGNFHEDAATVFATHVSYHIGRDGRPLYPHVFRSPWNVTDFCGGKALVVTEGFGQEGPTAGFFIDKNGVQTGDTWRAKFGS